MPRLPTAQDLGVVEPVSTRPIRGYDATRVSNAETQATGIEKSAIAGETEGFQQLGTGIASFGEHEQNLQDSLAVASGGSQLLQTKIALDHQFENDPDYSTWADRYGAAMANAKASALSGISGADAKAKASISYDNTIANAVSSIQEKAHVRSNQARAASVLNLGENAMSSAESNPYDGQSAEGLYNNQIQAIDAAVGSGALNAIEAQNYKVKFKEDFARRLLRGLPPQQRDQALGIGAPSTLGTAPVTPEPGPMADMISSAATAQGVDPNLALRTAQIESSMGRNLGTRGNIFQLGPSEWQASGGGDMTDVPTQVRNGLTFLKTSQDQLAANLGRQPEPWETYLAHQQGVAGATALLNAPADASAAATVQSAGNPQPTASISGNAPYGSGLTGSATAGQFRDAWKTAFQGTATRGPTNLLPSGAVIANSTGKLPSSYDISFGDSIAVGGIRHAGVNGAEADSQTGADQSGTARVNAPPSEVLRRINDYITANPGDLKGKNVLLSSGASNNPDDVYIVGAQLLALKDAGANVTVLGVGTKSSFVGVNDKIKEFANATGANFVPLANVGADGVHPTNYRAVLSAATGSPVPANAAGTGTPVGALRPSRPRRLFSRRDRA